MTSPFSEVTSELPHDSFVGHLFLSIFASHANEAIINGQLLHYTRAMRLLKEVRDVKSCWGLQNNIDAFGDRCGFNKLRLISLKLKHVHKLAIRKKTALQNYIKYSMLSRVSDRINIPILFDSFLRYLSRSLIVNASVRTQLVAFRVTEAIDALQDLHDLYCAITRSYLVYVYLL